VAIDPNQKTQYANIGRELVRRCGLADALEVIEAPSYRALPALFSDILAGRRPRFDLIYIDGWHTFDYTLIDFFYADLLLEVNGMIVLDDIKHPPVKNLLAYVVKNYPHYRLVPRTPCFGRSPALSSQATFIKIREDARAWNHHADF
jgi:predicted O-methyltransferase YrrM